MPVISALTTFTANTRAKAAEVNANFSAIRTTVNTYACFTDVAATITAAYTFSAAPTFSLGATVTAGGFTVSAGGVTVAAGGAAITGNSSVTGTLAVSSNATVGGTLGVTSNATVGGNLIVTGSASFGSVSVPAASVTAGTFAAGNFVFPGNVTAASGTVSAAALTATNGVIKANRPAATTVSGSVTVDLSTGNHQRITLNGAVSNLAFSNGVAGTRYTLEVTQNATGGHSIAAWSGNIKPAGGAFPTNTTTANRTDEFFVHYDGSNYRVTGWSLNIDSV